MTHVPIDIVLDIMKEHSLVPDDILKITVETRKWASTLKSYRPINLEQAVYSIPFTVGIAVAEGDVSPRQMREERLNDPYILNQADKVELIYNPELDEGYKERWKASVNMETKRGNFRIHRSFAKGDSQNQFTQEELKAKFSRAASGNLGESSNEIMNGVLKLETLPQVNQLTMLMNSAVQRVRAS